MTAIVITKTISQLTSLRPSGGQPDSLGLALLTGWKAITFQPVRYSAVPNQLSAAGSDAADIA
jgi:hypothetical protein